MKPYVRAMEQRLDVSNNYKRQKGIPVPSETAGLHQELAKRFQLVWLGSRQRLTGWEEGWLEQVMRAHFSPEQGYKGQELALHCRQQGHSQMACLTGGVKHNDRDEEVYEGRDFEAVNLTFPLKNILMGVARWDKVEGGRERERKVGKRMKESLGLKGSEKVQE